MKKQWRDFTWLLRGEMYTMRMQWFWYLFYMALNPVLNMFLLYMFGGRGNQTATMFAITGGLAQGLTISSMLTLGQNIGGLKDQNAYEHYATLPISKVTFLLAMATRAMIFSLPSFVIILVVGASSLGLPFHPSLLTIPTVFLAGYSLAGLGAFIGFYSPTAQVASLATQVLAGVMFTLAPVYVSLNQLPSFLHSTAAIIPTTYVASALRSVLSGVITTRTWTDLAVLGAVTLGSLWLVLKKLDWRAGQG